MAVAENVTRIGPDAYSAWRATALGRITEALEQETMLDLMGDVASQSVLDVGCGDGALLRAAIARGADGTGLDPDFAMLCAARERMGATGTTAAFVAGRAELLPFADASFDLVVAVTVLCFVEDAANAVREMRRVLSPGGRLVLGELGRWSLWAALRRLRGWFGARTWQHARFRSVAELRAILNQAGLSDCPSRGAVYYPPIGGFAQLVAPLDPWLGRRTNLGAAFIAIAAIRPPEEDER
jgi:ubiquinone/menaquinone biosynthesis C-methylase UbiE